MLRDLGNIDEMYMLLFFYFEKLGASNLSYMNPARLNSQPRCDLILGLLMALTRSGRGMGQKKPYVYSVRPTISTELRGNSVPTPLSQSSHVCFRGKLSIVS